MLGLEGARGQGAPDVAAAVRGDYLCARTAAPQLDVATFPWAAAAAAALAVAPKAGQSLLWGMGVLC